MKWLAVYEIHSEYGGPEEGGWYYQAGTLVASASVETLYERDDVYTTFTNVYADVKYHVVEWEVELYDRDPRDVHHLTADQVEYQQDQMNDYADIKNFLRPVTHIPKRAPHYE